MVVTVTTKEELKTALKNKENTILVKGKLAKKIKPLSLLKKSDKKINIDENMSTTAAAGFMSTIAGISVAVAITLIITVGIVGIVAMLNDYKMVIKDNEITLERN
ncbi:hypothetical protein [Clostridium sp.]|uniref:hypothetical protein n=1 Tax=Clostridium sp. TaxID=1506 RepID=UPI002FC61158